MNKFRKKKDLVFLYIQKQYLLTFLNTVALFQYFLISLLTTYNFMGRSKFYPHEKKLYDLRLKYDDLPHSIQERIDNWKAKKTKTGYHFEYVSESEKIETLISEWNENRELFEVMEEVSTTESILNDSENYELTEAETELDEIINEFETAQNLQHSEAIQKETENREEVEEEIFEEESETEPFASEATEENTEHSEAITKELGLSVPLDIRERLPQNLLSFRNSLKNLIEKACFDLIYESHEAGEPRDTFLLQDFEEKRIVKVFSDFSKYKGYKGQYYDIKRIACEPQNTYQIIPKHSLKIHLSA